MNNLSYTLTFPVYHKNRRANTNIKVHYQENKLSSAIAIEKKYNQCIQTRQENYESCKHGINAKNTKYR